MIVYYNLGETKEEMWTRVREYINEILLRFYEKSIQYLKRIGFEFNKTKQSYYKCNSWDIFLVLIYFLISTISVWFSKASLVALGLNGVCLVRIIIRNIIKNKENELLIQQMDNTTKKVKTYTHYFFKNGIYTAVSLIVIIVLILVPVEIIVKFISTLFLFSVAYDDIETIIVSSFEGVYYPFEREEQI